MTQKKGRCIKCQDLRVFRLHRQIFINGSSHFMWVCADCGKRAPDGRPLYIPNEKIMEHLTQEQVDDLPAIMPDLCVRCCVCGERNAELHHWAPKHLFGVDSENWPKDYLCKPCHDRWHSVVTPNMGGSNGFA